LQQHLRLFEGQRLGKTLEERVTVVYTRADECMYMYNGGKDLLKVPTWYLPHVLL